MWTKLFTRLQEFKANFNPFACICLYISDTDSITLWEMPTWPRLVDWGGQRGKFPHWYWSDMMCCHSHCNDTDSITSCLIWYWSLRWIILSIQEVNVCSLHVTSSSDICIKNWLVSLSPPSWSFLITHLFIANFACHLFDLCALFCGFKCVKCGWKDVKFFTFLLSINLPIIF